MPTTPTPAQSPLAAAVEQRNTPARKTPATIVREALEQSAGRFQAVLPRGFDQARFANLVLTAVKAKPQLLECMSSERGKVSLLLAAMQAATLGLEPDTPTQEAWLLPRRNEGTMECQLSIGYVGLIKLARRSGEVQTLYAEVVRQGDNFYYQLGTDPRIDHIPGPAADRGDLTHAYAVCRFKDGGTVFIVLDEVAVHARRSSSDSWRSAKARPFSPWTTSPEAMWRKSAIRALRPYLPLTAEAARALDTDERVLQFDDDGTMVPAVDADSTEIVDTPEGDQ